MGRGSLRGKVKQTKGQSPQRGGSESNVKTYQSESKNASKRRSTKGKKTDLRVSLRQRQDLQENRICGIFSCPGAARDGFWSRTGKRDLRRKLGIRAKSALEGEGTSLGIGTGG